MKQSGPRDLAELDRLKRSASNSLWMSHQEPPSQGARQFLTNNWIPWFTHYFSVMFHERHPFKRYRTGNGIFKIPDSVTVGLAARKPVHLRDECQSRDVFWWRGLLRDGAGRAEPGSELLLPGESLLADS